MNQDEAQQQLEEQQQWERDIELSMGEPDLDNCDGCGYTHPVRVTRWTPEGFRIRYGKDIADQLLQRPLPSNNICTDGRLEDTEQVCLCHECEFDLDAWSE